jgi:hypothetical protein
MCMNSTWWLYFISGSSLYWQMTVLKSVYRSALTNFCLVGEEICKNISCDLAVVYRLNLSFCILDEIIFFLQMTIFDAEVDDQSLIAVAYLLSVVIKKWVVYTVFILVLISVAPVVLYCSLSSLDSHPGKYTIFEPYRSWEKWIRLLNVDNLNWLEKVHWLIGERYCSFITFTQPITLWENHENHVSLFSLTNSDD